MCQGALDLLQKEVGDAVSGVLRDAVMSTVNLSAVVAKLIDHGMPARAARGALEGLSLDVRPFDREAAYAAGELQRTTPTAGLSMGDRACLAPGHHSAMPYRSE